MGTKCTSGLTVHRAQHSDSGLLTTFLPATAPLLSQPKIHSSQFSANQPVRSGYDLTVAHCLAFNMSLEQVAAGSNSHSWLEPFVSHRYQDWSMLNCYNSDLGQIIDYARRPPSLIRNPIVPQTVTCLLSITFEKQAIPNFPKDIVLNLEDSSSYLDIDSTSEACIKKHFESRLAGKSLNYRHGECTVIGSNGDKHIHELSSQEDWRDICSILVEVRISNRRCSFHLEIKRDYFGLSIRRSDGETLASLKRMEMFRLMQTAFDGRRYIALTDLSRVIATETVQEILAEDPIPDTEPAQNKSFTHDVLLNGRKLLAMCVYSQLRMVCLKSIMDDGHNDSSLQDRPLVDDDFCHEKCQPSFAALVQWQGGFCAAEFLTLGQNQFLNPSTVVPIHYRPKQKGMGSSFNEVSDNRSSAERVRNEGKASPRQDACCGSGAYSNVYRVKIDPAHHKLSKVRK